MGGAGHDASNLYLAVTLSGFQGRSLAADSLIGRVALDTYRTDLGQHALPEPRITSDIGFEFLVDLRGEEDGHLLITPEYAGEGVSLPRAQDRAPATGVQSRRHGGAFSLPP